MSSSKKGAAKELKKLGVEVGEDCQSSNLHPVQSAAIEQKIVRRAAGGTRRPTTTLRRS